MISHRTRRGFIDRLGATTLVAALRTNLLVSNDASASSITVDGVSVPLDAAISTAGATITDPQTAIAAGDVTVTTTNPNAAAAVSIAGRTVTVTVTAQDGTTVDRYVVNAALPAAARGTSTPVAAAATATTRATLPETGGDDTAALLVGGIGAALVLAGGILLARRRTKRTAD